MILVLLQVLHLPFNVPLFQLWECPIELRRAKPTVWRLLLLLSFIAGNSSSKLGYSKLKLGHSKLCQPASFFNYRKGEWEGI